MILQYPEGTTRERAEPVTSNAELIDIFEQLKAERALITYGRCVGLAAPQIGIGKQAFIALERFCANPVITYTEHWSRVTERCYSLPREASGTLIRPSLITVDFNGLYGMRERQRLTGLDAQVFCHEYDHLWGLVCTWQQGGLQHPDMISNPPVPIAYSTPRRYEFR